MAFETEKALYFSNENDICYRHFPLVPVIKITNNAKSKNVYRIV